MSEAKRYDLLVSGSMPVITFSDRGQHVLASDYDKIAARLAEAEKALCWYADEKNWDEEGVCGRWRGTPSNPFGPTEPEWDCDFGSVAKRHFEKHGGGE